MKNSLRDKANGKLVTENDVLRLADQPSLVSHLWLSSYLSTRYKLLYVSTPKVACTSFKWWFAALEGYSQALQAIADSAESHPELAVHETYKVAPHVTHLELERLSEALTSNSYFRFAIVRNPYKRIFSAWQSKLLLREPLQIGPYVNLDFVHHPIEDARDVSAAFEGFLEHLAARETPSFWDHHWTPQATLLRPDLINYSKLTKLENAGELSRALREWLGEYVPEPFALRRMNESLIPYLPGFVSKRSEELIRELFAEDFDVFDYDRQLPPSKDSFSNAQLDVAIKAIKLIRGRHERLGERAARINVLNETVAGYSRGVSERDAQIADLANAVGQRDQNIASLGQVVLQRDQDIADLSRAVAQRDQDIAGLGRAIAQRGEEIASLDKNRVEHGQEIVALNHVLSQRDQDIVGLNQTVAERDARILRLSSAVSECEKKILSLANDTKLIVAEKDQELDILQREFSKLQFELSKMLNSRSWRGTAFLRKLAASARQLLAPRRTLRENTVEEQAIDDQVRIILASEYFDETYYSKATGLCFETREAAARHYVSIGEGTDFLPSLKFDPFVYRTSYPDLAGFGQPLLIHYINHGRSEGRQSVFDLDQFDGEQTFDARRDTILVVVHELSQTGAPILGLNLVKHLSRDKNVICVACHGGPLLSYYRKHVHRLILPRAEYIVQHAEIVARRLVAPLIEHFSIHGAIVNSAESAVVAQACYCENLPVVSLVHEFAEYVFPRWKLKTLVESSQRVVFSSSLTEDSARLSDVFESQFTNAVVIPQGKSDAPAGIGGGGPLLRKVLQKVSDEKRFLVIGCGNVQIRKGVDLFIAAASQVAESLGSGNVCFLWVGDGYAPDIPGDYSGWLKDQIRRADVEETVQFVPAVDVADLESLYRQADVMLLSSRLDPFPNVAIDAMAAGLPIVCFDKATGIAEYLQGVSGSSGLVVPYLDVRAAADAIIGLKENPKVRNSISVSLAEFAESHFNFRSYTQRIETQLSEAVEANDQETKDAKSIGSSEFFRDNTYRWADIKGANRSEIIRQYVRLSAVGSPYAIPRPFAGLSVQLYAESLNLPSSTNAFAQWLRDDRPKGRWLRDVLELRGSPRKSTLKVALHIHLHYHDIADEILGRLQVNETKPDLFLTVTSDEAASHLELLLRGYPGKVEIIEVPNRGRDIASMVTVLSSKLQSYDLIGHLHAKKSPHVEAKAGIREVVVWREFLYENLIGRKIPALDLIAAYFETNPDVGLVFPEDPFICGWGKNLEFAQALKDRLKLRNCLPKAVEFPVGNMFMARPEAIRPLFDAGFAFDDFPVEPLPIDGTILHAIERMTAIICENEGYIWQTTSVPGISR